MEVFEAREEQEQILAVAGVRDFIGELGMLAGTAALGSGRGKAEETEVLQVPADRLRRVLAELTGVSEMIVSACNRDYPNRSVPSPGGGQQCVTNAKHEIVEIWDISKNPPEQNIHDKLSKTNCPNAGHESIGS